MSGFSNSINHKQKKYNPNIKYFGIPLALGISPKQQIGKENKKMFDRILTAKPTISNRSLSIHSKDEQQYRQNILKSKCTTVAIQSSTLTMQ